MRFNELFAGIPVLDVLPAVTQSDFTSLTADSRAVTPGSLFVCLHGEVYDGHRFIPDALRRGAAAVVISEPEFAAAGKYPYVLVPSTRSAYSMLYSNFCDRPADKLRMFAVTGTNGKTSVTHLLRAILCEAGIRTALIGTIGGSLTTPDPQELYPLLAGLSDSGVEAVVMEASSHALALKKLEPINFEAGIFTNFTLDHSDFHKTELAYFEAKSSLFDHCGTGVFNIDDKSIRILYDSHICANNVGVSAEGGGERYPDVEVCAKNIALGDSGLQYELVMKNKIFRICSDMPWRFNVYNTLCAAACALSCGIDHHAVQRGIASVKGVRGRLERVVPGGGYPGYPRIYIDYAHTPDALENAIAALRTVMRPQEKLSVLFGCGGDRDREKRPVMGGIASRDADFVILTEDNSRSEDPLDIIAAILSGMDKSKGHAVICDRREAIRWALENAKENDVLLLAGKGHENYMIDAFGRHDFSERRIIEEFYDESGKA